MKKKEKSRIVIILVISFFFIVFNMMINHNNNKPNVPNIISGMIPIYYDEYQKEWIKADESNEKNHWYDYDNQKWANAVLVTDNLIEKYQSVKKGTIIKKEDIIAYFVWIPRYKYKVFNINKRMGYDFYNAQEKGIEITFENGTKATGNIKCNYYYRKKILNNSNEICSGSNGQWYTHPAFTFNGVELTGIWVGKFETTGEKQNPAILPNASALTNENVVEQFQISQKFINYISDDKSNADSHMMKNIEWGAVSYLAHSKYGRCNYNYCSEIETNNNSMTGYGFSTNSNDYSYDTLIGINSSTTGNIYGIYDMNGGISEYVMANVSTTDGKYKLNQEFYSGIDNNWFVDNNKYLDLYAYNRSVLGHEASNITKLGDATGETLGWYDDNMWQATNENSWFERGGNYSTGKSSGLFAFGGNFGYNTRMNGFRVVMSSSR